MTLTHSSVHNTLYYYHLPSSSDTTVAGYIYLPQLCAHFTKTTAPNKTVPFYLLTYVSRSQSVNHNFTARLAPHYATRLLGKCDVI